MGKDKLKAPSANFMFASNLAQNHTYISVGQDDIATDNDDFRRLHLDDVYRIKLDQLVKFPTNRTYSEENIELLKKDILAEGFNTVIMVAEEIKTDPSYTDKPLNDKESSEPRRGKPTGRYIILRGHRRFDALSRAVKEDPSIAPDGCVSAYIVEPGLSWDRLKELNMTDNHRAERVSLREQRREIAELSRLYKKRGLKDSIDRISQYYNRNKAQIYKSLQISENLNSELLHEFDHGYITMESAVSLSRLSSSKQEEALLLYKQKGGLTDNDIDALTLGDHDETDTINKKRAELLSAQEQKQTLQSSIDDYYSGNNNDMSPVKLEGLKKQRDNLTKRIKRLQTCIDELEGKPMEDVTVHPEPAKINVMTARVSKMGKSINNQIKFMSKNISMITPDDIQAIDDIIRTLQDFKDGIEQGSLTKD